MKSKNTSTGKLLLIGMLVCGYVAFFTLEIVIIIIAFINPLFPDIEGIMKVIFITSTIQVVVYTVLTSEPYIRWLLNRKKKDKTEE